MREAPLEVGVLQKSTSKITEVGVESEVIGVNEFLVTFNIWVKLKFIPKEWGWKGVKYSFAYYSLKEPRICYSHGTENMFYSIKVPGVFVTLLRYRKNV